MSIPLADRMFSTVELTCKVKKLTPGVKQPQRSLPRNWIDTALNFAAFIRQFHRRRSAVSHLSRSSAVPRKLRPAWRERSSRLPQDVQWMTPGSPVNRIHTLRTARTGRGYARSGGDSCQASRSSSR